MMVQGLVRISFSIMERPGHYIFITRQANTFYILVRKNFTANRWEKRLGVGVGMLPWVTRVKECCQLSETRLFQLTYLWCPLGLLLTAAQN